jgi:hypothetical protein
MDVAFHLGDNFQILGSLWAQQWTQATGASQYANPDNYNVGEADRFAGSYSGLYSGALNDFQYVSRVAEETGDWNYYLIAEVMKAYTFQLLVDFFDKIPYSEALQGSANSNPKFDNGEDVYADLIVKIDNALSKDRAAATARPVGTVDLIFEGDMEQWVRFANTLKLKMFIRQSTARPVVAEAGIEALYASGAEFLEEDAEVTAFVDVEDFRNPFFATQIATTNRGYVDIAASGTLLGYLDDSGDPRIDAIYDTPVNGGPHAATVQGDYTNPAYPTHKSLSQPKIGPTHPVVLISAAESKFLQAEAVVRFSVAGDAQELYEEGIEASFEKLASVDEDFDGEGAADLYGAGGAYEFDPDPADAIEQIITQKWIAMANFQGAEAHLEHKRTDFPSFFTFPPRNVTGNIFPKRLPYPSDEVNNNILQLEAAGGQRTVTQRVWWNPA